ncbi:calmodulin-binding transcription activator 4 [Andrographis paniculata]|uniref:calmodulin-binding transcription activator 4 n=1 Tax=Andrographis paniculata TaxID=175694 RepID=UPI0021E8A1FB|nr:calmodulin-binding transcription activator 4 [Andrographis paniculata]
MQSGLDINHLAREAQTRWLKPIEVYFILKNHEEHQLMQQIPQKPTSGSLYLFNKRVLKFFRKDGHKWRRRKDQRTIAEAHERLKVGSAEALNCYYAHGEENPSFQRRSYWMLDPAFEHIVLVHYRDVSEGRQNARSTSVFSPAIISPSPSSYTHQPESSFVIGELHHNELSPDSVEINSGEINNNFRPTPVVNSLSSPDLNQALQKIKHQLSLNDDEVKDIGSFNHQAGDSNDLDVLHDYELSGQLSNDSDILLFQQHPGVRIEQQNHLSGVEVDIWSEMLDGSKSLPSVESHAQQGHQYASSLDFLQEDASIGYPTYSPPVLNPYGIIPDNYSSIFNQNELEMPLEGNISLTTATKQKFTIREISPDWCYSEGAKIVIIGSFLCDASASTWACMFGGIEVPIQIIQEGVLCCNAPPLLPGKVTLCITSGNRESCSEVREFEYRPKPSVCSHNIPPETSSEELLLLARLVQMLLSDSPTEVDNYGLRSADDSLNQIVDALLDGTSAPSTTINLLVQELLKDKLGAWLSSKFQKNKLSHCSLSKKEQGVIHMIAGLGFEWALQPILNSGVNVNFRDFRGWTALHWAARFGREKMVAALIASGASAGALTDPNSQDLTGKTPASIASISGHKGLAGYLSEVALTSHLSSLTMAETELSKGSAAVEAERTVNSLSHASSSIDADHVSLKHTLNAVRNATQAAARIQSAFRAHSFLKRQQKEAAATIGGASGDNYGILESDILGFSTAPKPPFRTPREHNVANVAALSIQKKYRGWKGRKDFLSLRQKVVKIQAHVRGYQVRKNYKVCWAVGILEKVVLRWRRRGVGLRGFRQESESVDEIEDEDILKVFRKTNVDVAIDEAVSRVLSMVESPKARQQYQRLLEKYRQAKAELKYSESDTPTMSNSSSSYHIPY